MPPSPYSQRWRSWRRRIVCCLLVALPLGGLSSSLVELLGPYHFHRQVQTSLSALADWQDFRRVDHAVTAGRPVAGHSALHRHHHAPSDVSVAAVGGRSGDGVLGEGNASFDGSPLAWALGGEIEIRPPSVSACHWPGLIAAAEASCDTDPLERPPRA